MISWIQSASHDSLSCMNTYLEAVMKFNQWQRLTLCLCGIGILITTIHSLLHGAERSPFGWVGIAVAGFAFVLSLKEE